MLGRAVADQDGVRYVEADEAWRQEVGQRWGEKAARHMHLSGGFSIVALVDDELAGLLSVCWQDLPSPLTTTREGYIDIIEVPTRFRMRGIARKMIELAVGRARENRACQLRAWSSEDKIEATLMWKALGFGLCPAVTYPRGQQVRGYFVTRVL